MCRASALHLGQVGGQVAGEPAVSCPEGLGLRPLGIPHDAEPIVEGVEAHDAVIPDPELLPAVGEAEVLGGESQEAGVGVDGLLPKGGAAVSV